MRKKFGFCLMAILVLQGCSSANESNSPFVEWGEYSPSQEKRLKQNKIDFKIKNGVIYIEENQLDDAASCCS